LCRGSAKGGGKFSSSARAISRICAVCTSQRPGRSTMRAKYPSDLQSGNHPVLKRQKSGDGSLRTSSPSLPIYDRLQRAWAIGPALLSMVGHAEYLCLEASLFPAFHPPPQNNSAMAPVLASPSPSLFFSYDTAAAGLSRQCPARSGDLLWLGNLRVGHPVGCTLQVYGLEIFCVAKKRGGDPRESSGVF